MRFCSKTALALSILASVSTTSIVAQTKTTAVRDVLPKVVASPHIEALRQQLTGVMVFRDPVTGEFRAPDPGEHATVTGGRAGFARVAPPAAGRLADGGLYLKVDPAKLQFMTVTKNAAKRPEGERDEK